MQVSNIHKAYGCDSVFQVLVGSTEQVPDGNDHTDWKNCGYDKIRAVKDSSGLYLALIRSDAGELMFEGRSIYEDPAVAISFGIEVYKAKFAV